MSDDVFQGVLAIALLSLGLFSLFFVPALVGRVPAQYRPLAGALLYSTVLLLAVANGYESLVEEARFGPFGRVIWFVALGIATATAAFGIIKALARPKGSASTGTSA